MGGLGDVKFKGEHLRVHREYLFDWVIEENGLPRPLLLLCSTDVSETGVLFLTNTNAIGKSTSEATQRVVPKIVQAAAVKSRHFWLACIHTCNGAP